MAVSGIPNIVSKIMARQISESKHYRRFGVSASSRLFKKLPGRLCFPLSSLVDASTLKNGHIFLGFTKDGNYIMSYTHLVGPDEESGKISHVYYLHWWLFVPYQRLRKIAKVRLFGGKDAGIESGLSISVCQWPSDLSKVLVYATDVLGHTRNTYITIIVIPLVNCPDCHKARLQCELRHTVSSTIPETKAGCGRCRMAVHYVNQHVPVYPLFLPAIAMKVDGVCVINGGDSLIALAVNLDYKRETGAMEACLQSRQCASVGGNLMPGLANVQFVEKSYTLSDAMREHDSASPGTDDDSHCPLLDCGSPRVIATDYSGSPLAATSHKSGMTCKLLTLDIERSFLSELCDDNDYGFVDFDVTILDVCEISCCVVAQIAVLCRSKCLGLTTSLKSEKVVESKAFDMVTKNIKFVWSLNTGAVTILSREDFAGTSDDMKSWLCSPKEPFQLQSRFGSPSSVLHSVTCMTNAPVLRGESLKMLVDCNNYIAIML